MEDFVFDIDLEYSEIKDAIRKSEMCFEGYF